MEWKKMIEEFRQAARYMKPNPPATERQISEVEMRLNVSLPQDIKGLLREFNGDNWLIFSTEEIIETNELQRKAYDLYMPLDCLLFFAGNGCGDYFGYPITRQGVNDNDIFMWEHENDSRVWKARGLADMITKYYGGEI